MYERGNELGWVEELSLNSLGRAFLALVHYVQYIFTEHMYSTY